MKIIRAYELQKWDIFIKQGGVFLVIRVTDTQIQYTGYNRTTGAYVGNHYFLGRWSQERLEYLGERPKKKKTKPYKNNSDGYDPTWRKKPIKHSDPATSYNGVGATFRNLK